MRRRLNLTDTHVLPDVHQFLALVINEIGLHVLAVSGLAA